MRRTRLAVSAAVACLTLLWSGAAVAMADDDYVQWRWDGPTVNIDWEADNYATAQGSFLGTPVVVPGDTERRTATVKNLGESDAVATVQVINVSASSDGATNLELQDGVHLVAAFGGRDFDATWRQAINEADQTNAYGEKVSWEASFEVPQGGEFQVMLGAYMPLEETTGETDGAPSQILEADVRVILQGDTPPPAVLPPASSPAPGGGPAFATGGSAVLDGSPRSLAWVGASILATGLILFWWRRRSAAKADATTAASTKP